MIDYNKLYQDEQDLIKPIELSRNIFVKCLIVDSVKVNRIGVIIEVHQRAFATWLKPTSRILDEFGVICEDCERFCKQQCQLQK